MRDQKRSSQVTIYECVYFPIWGIFKWNQSHKNINYMRDKIESVRKKTSSPK